MEPTVLVDMTPAVNHSVSHSVKVPAERLLAPHLGQSCPWAVVLCPQAQTGHVHQGEVNQKGRQLLYLKDLPSGSSYGAHIL